MQALAVAQVTQYTEWWRNGLTYAQAAWTVRSPFQGGRQALVMQGLTVCRGRTFKTFVAAERRLRRHWECAFWMKIDTPTQRSHVLPDWRLRSGQQMNVTFRYYTGAPSLILGYTFMRFDLATSSPIQAGRFFTERLLGMRRLRSHVTANFVFPIKIRGPYQRDQWVV